MDSDVGGRTTPLTGHETRKQQYSRARLQSFKENQESKSSSSPKSNHSSIVFPLDDQPGLEDGDTNLSVKENRTCGIRAWNFRYWGIVLLTSATLSVSYISASLLGRFYFDKGGKSLWLYTLSQSVGFPLTALVMIVMRMFRKLKYTITWYAVGAYFFLGIIVAIDNVFYSWSVYYLPISTVGLLGATHVGFTSLFAYLLVKKKLTAFSLNCVILVTLSAVILELGSGPDHSNDSVSHSRKNYIVGFVMSILANLLYGLLLPLMELILGKLELARIEKEAKKNSRQLNLEHDNKCLEEDKYLEIYVMLEMHIYSTAFASAADFIALMVSGDYNTLKSEMKMFEGGMGIYWLTFVCSAVGWQLNALTSLRIIMLTSSLFAGVLNSFNLPFLAVAAVIFFGDEFGGLKVVAMIVSLWGFASYLYGGYLDSPQENVEKPVLTEYPE